MSNTTIALSDLRFDAGTALISNNQGLRGELRARSEDKTALLTASLASLEPDHASPERRAVCHLSVKLELRNADGSVYPFATDVEEYMYYGDDPGDHLQDLLHEGELVHYLETADAV